MLAKALSEPWQLWCFPGATPKGPMDGEGTEGNRRERKGMGSNFSIPGIMPWNHTACSNLRARPRQKYTNPYVSIGVRKDSSRQLVFSLFWIWEKGRLASTWFVAACRHMNPVFIDVPPSPRLLDQNTKLFWTIDVPLVPGSSFTGLRRSKLVVIASPPRTRRFAYRPRCEDL